MLEVYSGTLIQELGQLKTLCLNCKIVTAPRIHKSRNFKIGKVPFFDSEQNEYEVEDSEAASNKLQKSMKKEEKNHQPTYCKMLKLNLKFQRRFYVCGARGSRVHARLADLSMQTRVNSQSYTKYTPSRTSRLLVLASPVCRIPHDDGVTPFQVPIILMVITICDK